MLAEQGQLCRCLARVLAPVWCAIITFVAGAGKQVKVVEFAHPQLGQEIMGRAGYYVPVEEHIVLHNGREVLCILGQAWLDNSCCSAAKSWGYVQVPGFLVRRHICRNESGTFVSEVDIIEDDTDRSSIRQSLLEKYPGIQIDMWGAQYGREATSHSAAAAAGNTIRPGGIA